ncbi:ABC transporter permease [Anaerosalibacter sp. Marseille-P3206]|uniref:ABC transporter permease n=1 Tax=Anaerosalibacter sp. Marseille-P3206 TaxID=1871005 RepID=UPI00098470A3|nr:ABC transporter permease [Anaerosalibacter sp. Marseille-P3206]
MLKYFVKKLLAIIPMLLLVSALVFFALELSPVDPINYLASPDMTSTENLEALRESLGLNDPVYIRYFRWLSNILKGDFGYSISTGAKISDLIKLRLPATLELSIIAIVLSTILGIGLGLISAIKQNSIVDYIGRIIGVVGISIPQFFFGIVVIQIFAIKLGWLPFGGRLTVDAKSFADRIPNMILPSFTMAISMTAALLRYTRNSMLDVLNKDYIKTARSKGIPEWKVYIKHAFRNSLGPILVLLAFRLPLLVGGSVVIESVFSYPGIGSLILAGVSSNDYPVIMITTLMVAVAILLSSFLVDLVTAVLDPRVRFDK